MGMIWTWALQRATGANAMCSVSDKEVEVRLAEYMEINPFTMSREIIPEPYPCYEYNLMNYIHIEDH